MNNKLKQSGLSIVEMTIVVATVALLATLSIPAIRAFQDSFATVGTARSMIAAALSTARAIAAKEHRYAGVRFQQDLNRNQYMVFIVHDLDRTDLAYGFRAVENVRPVNLPDGIAVSDLRVRINHANPADPTDNVLMPANLVNSGNLITETQITYPGSLLEYRNRNIIDTTTFSIVFSPSGKMVVCEVRVSNRDGVRTPENRIQSADDIFNSPRNIEGRNVEGIDTGMFVQDDYAEFGLGQEFSRNSFVIYEQDRFDSLNNIEQYNYLFNPQERIYINPYTGTIIDNEQ